MNHINLVAPPPCCIKRLILQEYKINKLKERFTNRSISLIYSMLLTC